MRFESLLNYLSIDSISPEHEFSKKTIYRIFKTKIPQEAEKFLSQAKSLDLSAFPEAKKIVLDSFFFKFIPQIENLNLDYQMISDKNDLSSFVS